jgi:hypothetical protein
MRKALAVLGVGLGFVLAAFTAQAIAQPTITIQSATLLDDEHIQVTGTATCTTGTNIQTLFAFVLQRTANEPRDGNGSLPAAPCPSDGAVTWSIVAESGGAASTPFYWRPGRAFVRASIIECTTTCTFASDERNLIVRPH